MLLISTSTLSGLLLISAHLVATCGPSPTTYCRYSPGFSINGHAWKIYVYPKGNNNKNAQLSIYLDSGISDAHEQLHCTFKLAVSRPTHATHTPTLPHSIPRNTPHRRLRHPLKTHTRQAIPLAPRQTADSIIPAVCTPAPRAPTFASPPISTLFLQWPRSLTSAHTTQAPATFPVPLSLHAPLVSWLSPSLVPPSALNGWQARSPRYPSHQVINYKLDTADSASINAQESVVKESVHTFCKRAKDWGFREFMPLDKLVDPQAGFVNEGTITLGVFIELT